MSAGGYGSVLPKGIAVPHEFTLVPSLVDLLNTLDQVEHPRLEDKSAVPPHVFVALAPTVEPADRMREHLVTWHNQLVTVQRQRIVADNRTTEQEAEAKAVQRRLQDAQEQVAKLRQSVDLSHAAQSKLQAEVDSLTVQNESLRALLEEARAKIAEQQPIIEQVAKASEARVAAGRKSAHVRQSRKAVKS